MIMEAVIMPSQWISGMKRLNPMTRSAGRFPRTSTSSSVCIDRSFKEPKANNKALTPMTVAANIGKNAADSISVKVARVVPGMSCGRVKKMAALIQSATIEIIRSFQRLFIHCSAHFVHFFYPAIIDVMTQALIGNFDAKIFFVLKQHVMILFKSKILKNE